MAQCVCSCCSGAVFQVPHLGGCPKPFPESIPSWSWSVCWLFLVCCFPYKRKPGVQRAPSFGPLYLFPSTFSPDVFLPGSGLSAPPWRCSWHSPPHHMPRTCNSNIIYFFFLQEITHFPSRTTSPPPIDSHTFDSFFSFAPFAATCHLVFSLIPKSTLSSSFFWDSQKESSFFFRDQDPAQYAAMHLKFKTELCKDLFFPTFTNPAFKNLRFSCKGQDLDRPSFQNTLAYLYLLI